MLTLLDDGIKAINNPMTTTVGKPDVVRHHGAEWSDWLRRSRKIGVHAIGHELTALFDLCARR